MGNHGLDSAAVTAAIAEEAGWHRDFYLDLHQHPELSFAEHRTARRIADRLQEFGFDEVHTGVGGTGVVGVLRNGEGTGVLARADMDALPVKEIDGDHASTGFDPQTYRKGVEEGNLAKVIPGNHANNFVPDYEPTLKTGSEAMTVALLAYLGN